MKNTSIQSFGKKKIEQNNVGHLITFRHLDDENNEINNFNQLRYKSFILTPTQKKLNENINKILSPPRNLKNNNSSLNIKNSKNKNKIPSHKMMASTDLKKSSIIKGRNKNEFIKVNKIMVKNKQNKNQKNNEKNNNIYDVDKIIYLQLWWKSIYQIIFLQKYIRGFLCRNKLLMILDREEKQFDYLSFLVKTFKKIVYNRIFLIISKIAQKNKNLNYPNTTQRKNKKLRTNKSNSTLKGISINNNTNKNNKNKLTLKSIELAKSGRYISPNNVLSKNNNNVLKTNPSMIYKTNNIYTLNDINYRKKDNNNFLTRSVIGNTENINNFDIDNNYSKKKTNINNKEKLITNNINRNSNLSKKLYTINNNGLNKNNNKNMDKKDIILLKKNDNNEHNNKKQINLNNTKKIKNIFKNRKVSYEEETTSSKKTQNIAANNKYCNTEVSTCLNYNTQDSKSMKNIEKNKQYKKNIIMPINKITKRVKLSNPEQLKENEKKKILPNKKNRLVKKSNLTYINYNNTSKFNISQLKILFNFWKNQTNTKLILEKLIDYNKNKLFNIIKKLIVKKFVVTMKKAANFKKFIKNDDIFKNNSVRFMHYCDYNFNNIRRKSKSPTLLSKIIRFKSSRFPYNESYEEIPQNLQNDKFLKQFLDRHCASTSDLNRLNSFNNISDNTSVYNKTNNNINHHKNNKSDIVFNTYNNMIFTNFNNKNKGLLIDQVNQLRMVFNILQNRSNKKINEKNKKEVLKNYFYKWLYNFKKEKYKINEKIINFNNLFQTGTTRKLNILYENNNFCNNNLHNNNINNMGMINNKDNMNNYKSTPNYFNNNFNTRYIDLNNIQNSSPEYIINNSTNTNNFYYNILFQRNNSYNNINLKTINNYFPNPKVIYQRKIIRASNSTKYNSNNISENNNPNYYINLNNNNKKSISNNINSSCANLIYGDPNQPIDIYNKYNCLNTDLMNNNNSFYSANPLSKSVNSKNMQSFLNSFSNKKNYGEEKCEYKKFDKIEEKEINFSQKKYNKKSDTPDRLSEYNTKNSCLKNIRNNLFEKVNDINETKEYIMIDENQDNSNTTTEIADDTNKISNYNKNINKIIKDIIL